MMGGTHTIYAANRQMIDDFDLDSRTVNSIANAARARMADLLASDGATQIPSFVTKFPHGSETGKFLVVDLGGSHCRVCLIDLQGNSQYELKHAKTVIPKEVMTASSHQLLFDFVATKIQEFLHNNLYGSVCHSFGNQDSQHGSRELLRLSFTFSFTYKTVSLSEGKLLQWDKGWNIPDAIGRDPCQMLQSAIDRQGMSIYVCALTNDSVSTLVAEAFLSGHGHPPLASIIIGTGTNAAYAERVENIVKLREDKGNQRKQAEDIMVINSEWGAWFDNNPHSLPQTEYDQELDAGSSNPNRQVFEKMVSGLYLGELLRLAILGGMRQNILAFRLDGRSPLHTPYGLDGELLSYLANTDPEDADYLTLYLSTALMIDSVTSQEARFTQELSAAIVRRAARLLGAVTAALIMQSGRLSSRDDTISFKRREQAQTATQTLNTTIAPAELRLGKFLDPLQCPKVEAKSGRNKFETEKYVTRFGTIDIGIEGSLFEFYPSFESEMRQALREIKGIDCEGEASIRFNLTRDGSTLGAALIACSIA